VARPSLADERREQIIEATLRTIADVGVSATTLDRIATTAGMSRGHVRHFVGNREALLIDAARAFYSEGSQTSAILSETITTLDEALDYLFGEEFVVSNAENVIVFGFVELSRSIPAIAQVLTDAYLNAQSRLDQILAETYPDADPETRIEAAVTVLATAMGNVFLEGFNHDPERPAKTRRMAAALLDTL
jgi:TetR/AcrR family transcriptional repressor of bet genes